MASGRVPYMTMTLGADPRRVAINESPQFRPITAASSQQDSQRAKKSTFIIPNEVETVSEQVTVPYVTSWNAQI